MMHLSHAAKSPIADLLFAQRLSDRFRATPTSGRDRGGLINYFYFLSSTDRYLRCRCGSHEPKSQRARDVRPSFSFVRPAVASSPDDKFPRSQYPSMAFPDPRIILT